MITIILTTCVVIFTVIFAITEILNSIYRIKAFKILKEKSDILDVAVKVEESDK